MKKVICVMLLFSVLCGLLCSCAAKVTDAAIPQYEAMAETNAAKENYMSYDTVTTADGSTVSLSSNRKLVRTVNLTVETENYAELLADIEARVSSCGGYIEHMEANTRYSSSTRNAYLTIRVPANSLDAFTGGIAEISNVVYRSESNEDITTTYVDTQSRRDALAIEQERLLVLLEQAQSLNDILEIESRLTEVRYELENIEAQLRTYDNMVDYATISMDINEVKVYTDVEEKSFWENIGDGFLDSLEGVWNGAKSIFSFLIIALPYLVLIAIIPIAIILPIRHKIRKNRKAQKENSDGETE